MKRDVRTDPDGGRFCHCFDAETGEELKNVVWADDEAGLIGVYETDQDGKIIIKNDELVVVTRERAIRLVDDRLSPDFDRPRLRG